MAPPKFDDLGKAGNDLFEKNYDFGKVKFELKNKNEGMDLVIKGDQNVASSAIKGSVESNFKCSFSGMDVKKTWHTHNALDIEVAKSGLASGLGKTVLTASFTPDGGVALGKFKQNISKDNLNLNVNSTMAAAPKIGMDAVFAHKNFNVGFSTGYCVKKSACTGQNVAFAMQQGAINAVLKSSCKSDAALTVFNKLNDQSVLAVSANYSAEATSMGVAYKTTACTGVTAQYKLMNSGRFGASYASKLAACDLTVSADIDLLNLQGGGHKFGSAFKFAL
jgi:hypothetical protein